MWLQSAYFLRANRFAVVPVDEQIRYGTGDCFLTHPWGVLQVDTFAVSSQPAVKLDLLISSFGSLGFAVLFKLVVLLLF